MTFADRRVRRGSLGLLRPAATPSGYERPHESIDEAGKVVIRQRRFLCECVEPKRRPGAVGWVVDLADAILVDERSDDAHRARLAERHAALAIATFPSSSVDGGRGAAGRSAAAARRRGEVGCLRARLRWPRPAQSSRTRASRTEARAPTSSPRFRAARVRRRRPVDGARRRVLAPRAQSRPDLPFTAPRECEVRVAAGFGSGVPRVAPPNVPQLRSPTGAAGPGRRRRGHWRGRLGPIHRHVRRNHEPLGEMRRVEHPVYLRGGVVAILAERRLDRDVFRILRHVPRCGL